MEKFYNKLITLFGPFSIFIPLLLFCALFFPLIELSRAFAQDIEQGIGFGLLIGYIGYPFVKKIEKFHKNS